MLSSHCFQVEPTYTDKHEVRPDSVWWTGHHGKFILVFDCVVLKGRKKMENTTVEGAETEASQDTCVTFQIDRVDKKWTEREGGKNGSTWEIVDGRLKISRENGNFLRSLAAECGTNQRIACFCGPISPWNFLYPGYPTASYLRDYVIWALNLL